MGIGPVCATRRGDRRLLTRGTSWQIPAPASAPPATSGLPRTPGPRVLMGKWGRRGRHHEGAVRSGFRWARRSTCVCTHVYTHVTSVSLECLGQCRDSEDTVVWPLTAPSRELALATWTAELGVVNPCSGAESKAERPLLAERPVRCEGGRGMGPRGHPPPPGMGHPCKSLSGEQREWHHPADPETSVA